LALESLWGFALAFIRKPDFGLTPLPPAADRVVFLVSFGAVQYDAETCPGSDRAGSL
jgi:hypothetical protein